jgi:hypothetical protein
MAKREGPIHPTDGDQQMLRDAGQYLALSSYDPALDHLLRCMSRMAKDFSQPTENFVTTMQLLRAVGAPGLGKSTFLKSAWSLLRARLKEVQADEARWRGWRALGVDLLQERLESSWETPFGPLVYEIDMSNDGEWMMFRAKGFGWGWAIRVWVALTLTVEIAFVYQFDTFSRSTFCFGSRAEQASLYPLTS